MKTRLPTPPRQRFSTRASTALACGGLFWATSVHSQSFSWSTIAGLVGYTNSGFADGTNGDARLNHPDGITVNSSGTIYVGDYGNNRIRQITPVSSDWVVTTIAGNAGNPGAWPTDGTNTYATFDWPQGIVLDGSGSLFVADSGHNVIRQMVPVGTNWVTTTIAGGYSFGHADGTNRSATYYFPNALALYNDGSLIVVDNGNNTIRKITPYGTNWVTTTIAGSPMASGTTDGTNSGARFYNPNGVAADAQGNIYVADSFNNTIRQITQFGPDWVVTTIVGTPGPDAVLDGTNKAARLSYPLGIIVDPQGNLYVSEGAEIRRIVHIGSDWIVSTIGGPHLNSPNALFLDSFGNLLVADTYNNAIRLGQPTFALQLALSGSQLVLSWPRAASNFVLQTTGSPGPDGLWSNLPGSVLSGDNFFITNDANAGAAFYRLRK